MKKKHIVALAIGLVVLLGLVISIRVINGKKDRNSDYIVHEKDEDTVEIETENGLNQSESEDGPVLDEDDMIDFNGGNFDSSEKSDKNETIHKEDGKTDVTPDKDDDNEDDAEEPETPDTGVWGTFY